MPQRDSPRVRKETNNEFNIIPVRLAIADKLQIELLAVLEGLTSDDFPAYVRKFEVGGFSIGPYDPSTLDRFSKLKAPLLSIGTYAAKITLDLGEGNAMNPPIVYETLDSMITCFRLFHRGYVGISFGKGHVIGASESQMFLFGSPVHSPQGGMLYRLVEEELTNLERFSSEITPLLLSDKLKSLRDPALRFFNRGITDSARSEFGLAIVDFTSCLEALFSKSPAELGHRLSEVTAWVTQRDANERPVQYSNIKQLYALRSKIIHGSKIEETSKELSEKMTFAEILARRSLRTCLGYHQQGLGKDDILGDVENAIFGKVSDLPGYAFRYLNPEYSPISEYAPSY